MKHLLQFNRFMVMMVAMLTLSVTSAWGAAKTVTYAVTSKSAVSTTGTAPTGSSAEYAQTYSTASQATSGNSMTLTLKGYVGQKITGITMSMHSNSKQGAGTLSVTAGTTSIAGISTAANFNKWYDNTSFGSAYRNVTVTLTNSAYAIQKDENVVISIACTTNSLYCESFAITYDAAGGGTDPELSFDGTLDPFTYIEGNGPSEAQTIVVKGSNLTDDLVFIEFDDIAFEVKDEDMEDYQATITLGSTAVMSEDGATIYVRMKADLSSDWSPFNDILIASSDGAENAEIALTGTVTALAAPSFTTQPVGASYEQGATPTDLSVVAEGNPAPALQWYSNTTQSTTGATELTGATNATYTPSTATIGTTYYYCVATNSQGSATSDIVAVEVTENVVTPGTYNIVPNNTFWGNTQSGSKTVTQNTAFGPKTQDDVTISMNSGTSTSSYINASSTRVYNGYTFTVAAPSGFKLTKIEFTGSTWVAPSASKGTMNSKTWTGGESSVTFSFTGTSYMTNIEVTYAADDQVATPVLKINDAEVTADAEYCGAQEVTLTCSTADAAISYSTDGGTNWTAYSAPIEVTATATLRAKATKTGLTDSEVNTKAFTINDPIANDSASAYTTAEAIAKIEAGKCLTDTVFVKGTISKIDSYSEQYSSITYWLDSDAFEVYSGKGLNGANFTSMDDIKVGAEVIVKGIIKKWGSTYEFDKNNYLVAYKEPETPKTTATISLSGYKQTLAADDAANIVTIHYNGDGTLSAESSDPTIASVALTVTETDTYVTVTPAAAGGPVTITVSAPETELFTSASKYYTLNVTAGLTAAALPFSFDGGKNDINPANGIKQSGLGDDYKSSPKLKFDTQEDEVIIKVAEKAAQLTYKVKGNSFSNGKFDVMESTDGSSYSSLKSYTTFGTDAENDTVTPAAASRFFKFVYTTKSSGNVALGSINIIANLPKVDPTFSIANVDVLNGGSQALNITTNSTGAITYTIDPDDAGKIAIVENVVYGYTDGNYTVGAEIAATDIHNSKQTNFNVTVTSVAYKTSEYTTFTNLKDSLGQLGHYQAYKGGGTADAKIKDGQIYLYQPASGKNYGGYITIAALPGLKIAKIDFESAQGTTYNYKVDASNDYALTNSVDIEADDKETVASLNADSIRIYCLGASSSYRLYLSYLKVYYSGELENFNLAVAGVTKTEYEIGETVDHAGAVVTATFENAGARDVTINSTFTDPDMSTAGTKQVAANFGGKSATYDITVTAPTPEIEVSTSTVDFGTVAKNAQTSAKTVAVTLTAVASATVAVTGEGKDAFQVTPASLSASGDITITPVTTTEGTFTATITISATGAEPKTVALSMVVDANTDVLTASGIGVTSYGDWSNKTFTTTTKYAGNSTKGTGTYAGAIQIRTSGKNSGIVSNQTMGYIKSVSIDFNSLPAIGKSVDIYGSNVAYSSAADLHNDNKQGTKIGSATEDGAVTLAEGNYKYIGIRSSDGAMYMNSISIAWTPATFYAVTLTQTDNGTIATSTDAAAADETVTLTATPATDYAVASWTGLPEGATVSEDKKTVTFTMPTTALAISATFGQAYVRENTTIGNYGVVCLPKAVAAGDFQGAEVFKIVEKDANGKNLTIETVDELEAGRAYIILSNAETFTCMMTGEAVTDTIPADENAGLAGTLTGTSFTGDGSQYVIVNNKVMKAGQVNIGKNKAWIEMTYVPAAGQGAPQRAGSRRVTLGSNESQTTTGLDMLFMQEGIQKMMINGQLIIIRDGKMFNAQGQIVK